MLRLDRVQYAAAHRGNHNCLGVLDRPVEPGDDRGFGGETVPTHSHAVAVHPSSLLNNNFIAVAANTCMFANRSLLPVSSVITSDAGPAIAMQLWPAASP